MGIAGIGTPTNVPRQGGVAAGITTAPPPLPSSAPRGDSLATGSSPAAPPPANLASLGALPRTTNTEDGTPADPINLIFLGSRVQLQQAFSGTGWQAADKLSLTSAARMVWAFLTGKPYLTAPVSSLYLGSGDEHKEDLAFEREDGKTVNMRDHVRFWDTGQKTADGQEIWVGSASQDVGIEWNKVDYFTGPTHRISPFVDQERDTVVREMVRGGARDLGAWQRGAMVSTNGEGDPFYTDGNVAVLQAPAIPTPAAESPLNSTRSLFSRLWSALEGLFSRI